MSVIDTLLQGNRAYAESFEHAHLSAPPSGQVAIVACMDARLNIYALLGLQAGQAHVIRNAGGVVTEDVIRSLAISQRQLGTTEIVLIHHTQCGMQAATDEQLKAEIENDTGIRPPFAMETFDDPADDVRQSIARIKSSPFVPRKEAIRGFVYAVETGRLLEV